MLTQSCTLQQLCTLHAQLAHLSWLTHLLLICTGDVDSLGLGGPLTEGAVRYTIHPVTGHLITTEVQPPAKDVVVTGAHAHKPQREDKSILKVSCACLSKSVCVCVLGLGFEDTICCASSAHVAFASQSLAK